MIVTHKEKSTGAACKCDEIKEVILKESSIEVVLVSGERTWFPSLTFKNHVLPNKGDILFEKRDGVTIQRGIVFKEKFDENFEPIPNITASIGVAMVSTEDLIGECIKRLCYKPENRTLPEFGALTNLIKARDLLQGK